MNRRHWIGPSLLLMLVIAVLVGLGVWKYASIQASSAASANQPEPMEAVTVAVAREFDHRPTVMSIGTVRALRSITLSNELAGTVREVRFKPGQIVEAGSVLVALDVSVEEADLKAQQAQSVLATKVLNRRRDLSHDLAATKEEVDRARADLDVAQAQIARTKAVIAKKTIRAPFRSRVGLADIHVGQYLNEGTELTTLQGIDEAVHVDFTVPQQIAAGLQKGNQVEVLISGAPAPVPAEIVALDARVDPTTRNAMIRARIERVPNMPAPGASVRVNVPVGESRTAVVVPTSAVRRGPQGSQVFVVEPGEDGKTRAHARQIESGTMLGDMVVVHSGLAVGERVAASGSFKLRDGVLVAIAGDHQGEVGSNQALSKAARE